MLELNDVVLTEGRQPLSLIVGDSQMACLTGASLQARRQWLRAIMGFVPTLGGVISIDGTPLTRRSAPALRQLMAFAPRQLEPAGQICRYDSPSVQDIFSLRANRQVAISNGLLAEEMRRTGSEGMPARLIAVASMLRRPLLLVEEPPSQAADYLRRQADCGCMVVVTTVSQTLMGLADTNVDVG